MNVVFKRYRDNIVIVNPPILVLCSENVILWQPLFNFADVWRRDSPFSGWSLMSPSLGWFGLSDCPDSVRRERETERTVRLWFHFRKKNTNMLLLWLFYGQHSPSSGFRWQTSSESSAGLLTVQSGCMRAGETLLCRAYARGFDMGWLSKPTAATARHRDQNIANIIQTNQRKLSLSSHLTEY